MQKYKSSLTKNWRQIFEELPIDFKELLLKVKQVISTEREAEKYKGGLHR